LESWLQKGVGLASCPQDFAALAPAIQASRLLFVQHIFPVDTVITNYLAPEGSELLDKALDSFALRMSKTAPFAIQLRRAIGLNDSYQGELRTLLQLYFIGNGFSHHTRYPEQIISGYVTSTSLYLGLSLASQNLSSWNGGHVAYALRPDTISRSEFKLLEAIECFQLSLPTQGVALDLGAAPGGWTKILLERGLKVLAVDPGALDPRIKAHPQVSHYAMTTQQFLRTYRSTPVNLLVNDMRMDIIPSVELVNAAASLLAPDSLLIMTFKLPGSKPFAAIHQGLSLLQQEYSLAHQRQLFHNRQEVTIVAIKSPGR